MTGSRSSATCYDNASIDSQFTDDDDGDDEMTVLDACIDCDDDALYEIMQTGATWQQLNERDRSGRVGIVRHTKLHCYRSHHVCTVRQLPLYRNEGYCMGDLMFADRPTTAKISPAFAGLIAG